MELSYFKELLNLGLKPIPILWNAETKTANSHILQHSNITEENYNSTNIESWFNEFDKANGIALKLFPPFGMLDFDLKNTDKKNIFNDWLNIIEATKDDVLKKICIEKTRNGGFHVYIKYSKLSHKIQLAASEDGSETIAVYTGGLLSYCSPTPNYEMFHNSFEDLEELTTDEYDLLTSTAAIFNDYKIEFNNEFQPIEYPIEYDDIFETMLNELTLFEVRNFRYGKHQMFAAFLRKGSTAKYSAKVYFKSKKLLLFTTSITGFPTWQDNKGVGDRSWVLTPSRIIYYKNNRDWNAAIAEIQLICDSASIEILQKAITQQPLKKDRTQFPYDIFPEPIVDYIKCFNIQHEYIAASMLAAFATAIGNTCQLQVMDSYIVKPILYLALVAPAGSAKSPAIKIAFAPIEEKDNVFAKEFAQKMSNYNQLLNDYEKDKKNGEKPTKAILQQNLIKDATIEMVSTILNYNSKGCCLLSDELIGFLNRMNAYKSGDDMEKWLEMWDGSPILVQRLGRDFNKVFDYSINVFGGVQPGVLSTFSKGGNEFNGFYHRFCFCYPEMSAKPNFEQVTIPKHLKDFYTNTILDILAFKEEDIKFNYYLTEDAAKLYKQWYDHKNIYYNSANNDNIRGIISKYQGYCLRFALIIQTLNDGLNRDSCLVTSSNMEKAIRLTEYFFGNMNKALNVLNPETPIDTLRSPYNKIYAELEQTFSIKVAFEVAKKYKIKEPTMKMFISRNKELFKQIERGYYEKLL
jgi:hypothetical protein